ncbi:MAG TPA: molybdopterin cofactor-binding domain-containing protein [Bryobacteraceae bacterium]|jgi:isoquinoline 1-oxidoreductase beta subunit|nr:molybdopterin cofactor-binding domain-containing protein [Bryobacteraceae bacterium]
MKIRNCSRRRFLRQSFGAGAFVLGARYLPAPAAAALEDAVFRPNVFVGVKSDGTVLIVAHRSEMGTSSRTSVPMILADEMEADWKRVQLEQAIGDAKYGDQDTDGSHSVRSFFGVMQECGAAARTMLVQAGAAEWGVPAAECKATLHQVVHTPSGKKLGYGDLAAAAARLPVPAKSSLIFKKKSEYRYIGKDMPIYDLAAITHGTAVFGMDAKVDGMVYASVEHSPVLGGKIKSLDNKDALAVRGVSQTLVLPDFKPPHAFQALGGVAVIADNTWAAFQGRKKLKIAWDPGANGSYTSSEYKKQLQSTARQPGKVVRQVGDVEKGLGGAAKVLEAEYYVPLLAHAAMEPEVAVADFRGGKCTLWAPVQNPQAVQDTVAAALGIDKKDVICNVTLLGGGFGRKSKPDFCAEAAILSKQLGKPVKVVWTREDDIRFDYYHSVDAMYLKAGLDATGKPAAWLQRTVFPSIDSTFGLGVKYGGAGELGMGFVDWPFDIPNIRAENGEAVNHVRIGWMRSVANIYHAFAICSFADECAHAAGRDPKDYLLELIGPPRIVDLKAQGVAYANMGPIETYPVDAGRLRNVVEIVAEKSGWGKRTLPKGHALGIAAHRSFLTYIATVVEVAIGPGGKISIPRVDTVVDAGMIVNPDRVRSQFEGAAVFGASLALMGSITATNGKIDQSNYHNYPVARIHEAPYETHVHIVESDAPPAGVGEPGVPPFAPALCNAIFAATGKRIRELPIGKQLA